MEDHHLNSLAVFIFRMGIREDNQENHPGHRRCSTMMHGWRGTIGPNSVEAHSLTQTGEGKGLPDGRRLSVSPPALWESGQLGSAWCTKEEHGTHK